MVKIAIVTGASSGLGKIFVEALNKENDIDQIWVLARSEDRLQELADKYGSKIIPYVIDLSKHDEIIKFSERLEKCGVNIGYLVNNAGFGKFGSSMEVPLDDSLNMIDLNIKAVISMCNICIPYMKKGDHIINIASVASFMPIPYMNAYAATKVFVRNYSRALNVELKESGISVTAVCPLWMKTNFMKVGDIGLKKAPKVYKPTLDPKAVVEKAVEDAKKGKDVSVYSGYSKIMHVLSLIIPDKMLMNVWLKMQKL